MITVEPRSRIDLSAWGESFLSIYCVEPGVHFSDVVRTPSIRGFNDSSGLDFAIILDRRPASNVLRFPFKARGANLWHQPVLTLNEIAQGCRRPDHVVNSVAIYGKAQGDFSLLGGKNYGAGKWGHLYAMKALGQWCGWGVRRGVLTLTLLPVVLNLGTYPLVVYPVGDTFGYDGVGGSSLNIGSGFMRGTDNISGVEGTAASISVASDTGSIWRGTIYSTANARVDYTGEHVHSGVGVFETENVLLAATIAAATTYRLLIWSGGTKMYYDASTGSSNWGTVAYSSSNPPPATIATDPLGTSRYSIYVTYTPSAPAVDTPAIPLGFIGRKA